MRCVPRRSEDLDHVEKQRRVCFVCLVYFQSLLVVKNLTCVQKAFFKNYNVKTTFVEPDAMCAVLIRRLTTFKSKDDCVLCEWTFQISHDSQKPDMC
jgi:hypothetical protein